MASLRIIPVQWYLRNRCVKHYVVYNFSDAPLTVNFSNGVTVNAVANDFTVLAPEAGLSRHADWHVY